MDSATSCATAPKACRPHLIAIAGPSCAGKTTLAQGLVQALPSAVHFPLDAYYADLSNLLPEQRVQHNFDCPNALDYDLLHADLQALANGQPIRAPVYDFRTHTRQPITRPITPPKYLLIEGLFALYFPTLRALCSYRIYVDIDSMTSLERRIRRDSIERDRPEASVRQQFTRQVDPMSQRYIVPTRSHADCIVSGARDPLTLCAQIQRACRHLK
ncbi:MAG: uridine kinase family protein [Candidatus Latescibacterota bacterium]